MADDLEFTVKATDDASDVVERVAKAADKLDGTTAELAVDADAKDATRALGDVDEAAGELDGRDITATVKVAGAGAAADDVDKFRKSTDEAGESSKLAGNSVADMAGPFGDAEGAASTAAGVFDGLGDVVESLGPKLGLSASAAAGLATGIGIAGFAVAGAAAAWSKYRENQRKAREEAERMVGVQRDIAEALDSGDIDKAVAGFLEAFPKFGKAAKDAGVDAQQAFDFVQGASDTLPGLDKRLAAANARLHEAQEAFNKTGSAAADADLNAARIDVDNLEAGRSALEGYRDANASSNLTLAETKDLEGSLAKAYGDTALQAVDAKKALQELTDARLAAADANVAARQSDEAFSDSLRGVTDAQTALTQAIKEHGPASAEAAAASEALSDAEAGVATSAIDMANAHAEAAAQTAEAGHQVFTADDRIKSMNESLLASARVATPAARAEIFRYIGDIAGIPQQKITEILAMPDTAAADAALTALTQPKTVDVTATLHLRPPISGSREDILLSGVGRSAPAPGAGAGAGGSPAPVPLGFGAPVGPSAMAAPAAASIVVNVDARGAVDPYSVGRSVERAMRQWGRVSGSWRPGQWTGPG